MSALGAFLIGLAVLAAFVFGVPLGLRVISRAVWHTVTIWKGVLRL